MVQIELNNNKVRVTGNLKVLNKIYEELKVRHPNAYYLRKYMEPGWDGKIKFLSDAGYAKTGLFPKITSLLEEYNEEYTTIDNRKLLEFNEIPKKLGPFTPRYYQTEAVEDLVYNEVGGIEFPRGVISAATNAGKTLIAAMIHKSYHNAKTIILVNNSDLFNQFLDDMPQMFGDDWGYMQGKKIRWADIMVCMIPTLSSRINGYGDKLVKYNTLIYDECHLVTSKTSKSVLNKLYNTSIRVGLSGTAFSHKNKVKNMEVRAYFGDEVYQITNEKLIEEGYSSPIVIKMIKGVQNIRIKGDYNEEYRQAITDNRERERISIERSRFYLQRGKHPILIIGKYHDHVERLYEVYEEEFGSQYRVEYIHHKVKNRKKILDEFKDGKVDILISSLIIKLGQNMPLIQYMQNAASGDSQINALQLIGRALRKHKSKSKTYYEDFFDKGYYLQRHSKHRLQYYKHQSFKVLELYKRG